MAGRVVVANQVLLATMWYITSCWVFSSSCISQIQRLIKNFLWSGRDGQPTRAKVAWSVVTRPLAEGGLGLIDPIKQSRAFLGKLVVRSLLPGLEPWKELLLQRMHASAPPIRWVFVEMRRSGLGRGWADRFAVGILRAWERLRPGLGQLPPVGAEERLRQPLVWSPLVCFAQGQMLGSRPRLAWGQFAAGPARSWGDWLDFCRLPQAVQDERISNFCGGLDMRQQLLEAVPLDWFTPPALVAPQWMAAFTQFEVLVTARACSDSGSCLFFEVQAAGRLVKVEEEAGLI